eukprot:713022_1
MKLKWHFFLLGAFLPYGIAEALGLSGICSVLFAGIMTDYYTYHHLSPKSQITTRHVVSTLAYISELFVFIYLGMSFFLEKGHEFKSKYILITLLLCFCGRAISVFPLAFLLNMGRKHKLPIKHQIILWYSGLRGPVAYALAVATSAYGDQTDLSSNIIITTTIFIVAFTTLMLGGLAYPFLKYVKPPIMRSTKHKKTDTYDISNHWFNRLDRRFLRPYFGPKQRKNLNRPLTSAIEMNEHEQDQKSDIDIDNDNINSSSLIGGNAKKKKGSNSGAFDMEYINTNTNEEEAERSEEIIKPMNNNKKIHLNVVKDNTDTPKDSKSIVDYSMPRTQPPSFIDNPREEREERSDDQSNTWGNDQSITGIQSTNDMLQLPNNQNNINSKAVTPPP